MKGRAQALVLAHSDCNFDQFVAVLRTQFGKRNQRAACEAQLAQYRRKKGESIPQLKLQIIQLASWVYGDDKSENVVRLIRDHFIRALDDPTLIAEVYRRLPNDIDEAAAYACEYDAYLTSNCMPRCSDYNWSNTLPSEALRSKFEQWYPSMQSGGNDKLAA